MENSAILESPAVVIRRLRENANFSQLELSKRAGMSAAQLCKIERGSSALTSSTLRRVAEALGVSVSVLLGEGAATGEPVRAGGSCAKRDGAVAGYDCYVPVLSTACGDETVLRELARGDAKIAAEEERLGVSGQTALQLVYVYSADLRSAELLARDVRFSIGAGRQPVRDLAAVLESVGVRVMTIRRPAVFQSASFYNTSRRALVIALNSSNSAERCSYRLAYELGGAVRFASNGYKTVLDEGGEHRFLRDFAAAFLMPEEAVRGAVARLGIGPRQWTMKSLVYVKERFGVSAEAFALRLESLGLIAPSLRQTLRDELRARYAAHPRSMEPHPPKNQTCVDILKTVAADGSMKEGMAL